MPRRPSRLPLKVLVGGRAGNDVCVARKPLDEGQSAALAVLRAQNASWIARPRRQRLAISGACVLGFWIAIGLVGWLFSTRVGWSPAGIVMMALAALLLAALGLVRALWTDGMNERAVRSSVPRAEDLDRPWPGFGDLRPQDWPSAGTAAEDTHDKA